MPMRIRDSTIELGVRDERVAPGDHVAYFWDTRPDFVRGIAFLERGLRGEDHGVIFGHEDANAEVLQVLREHGLDPDVLAAEGRLSVLGSAATGDAMLANIGEVFERAVARGAPLIRLLGNIGWGRPGWPGEEDILAFEAKVTGAARAFPCVVLCMYDVQALPGRVMVHGAYETHPLTICGNVLRENPYYVGVDTFLARMSATEKTE
ncbi:MAG: MEDS domain-containing protein [Gemmatimonadota bacterium]|nr:MEDS domain-containing protein [Gemmatimonadota bacterium]